jgi:hypothetical protein
VSHFYEILEFGHVPKKTKYFHKTRKKASIH